MVGCAGASALLFFIAVFLMVEAQPTLVPAIITFGDSTVDVGNNNYLRTKFKANFPPYGRDFVNHRPTGRFCDGKLVTDFTADALGFKEYPLPYLSPEAAGKNLLTGVNFASAAAGYYDGTSTMYHAISLIQQLEYFKAYKLELSNLAGRSKAKSIISGALYLVSAGTGDLLQNYYINPHLNKIYSIDYFSNLLAANFTTFIKDLYGEGARRIGVTTLSPLGCLPASIALYGLGNNDCIARLNAHAENFNKKLNASVSWVAKKLPGLKIILFDIYTPLYSLATNPINKGFMEAKKGCCGTGTVKTSVLCNPKSEGTCKNPDQYVFWDSVHPSQAANKVISESMVLQGISLIL